MATPLHSRTEVGLRPPRSVSHNVTGEGDTVHWGGPSPWGSGTDRSSATRFEATVDHARCASIWRAWQAFHMDSRGWTDIAYNSGVCPHGHRYEGRGPGVRSAAQGTTDGNNRSYATVYIAGEGDPLTDPAKRAFLDEGHRLASLYRGHRDWKSTACPGPPTWAWRQAGFPSPGPSAETPTPIPEPPPVPEEESDMLIIRRQNGAMFLLSGGRLAGLKTTTDVQNLKAAGVKQASVTDKTWTSLANAFEVTHG